MNRYAHCEDIQGKFAAPSWLCFNGSMLAMALPSPRNPSLPSHSGFAWPVNCREIGADPEVEFCIEFMLADELVDQPLAMLPLYFRQYQSHGIAVVAAAKLQLLLNQLRGALRGHWSGSLQVRASLSGAAHGFM